MAWWRAVKEGKGGKHGAEASWAIGFKTAAKTANKSYKWFLKRVIQKLLVKKGSSSKKNVDFIVFKYPRKGGIWVVKKGKIVVHIVFERPKH